MNIITLQLAKKLPRDHKLLVNQVINPKDFSELCSVLKQQQQLTIYDMTTTESAAPGDIISVSDHINRTGINPLIGKQRELDIDFIDITKLYNGKTNAVNTDCCGYEINRKYPYPSHYLCNISILAKAMRIQNISAFLINIL